MARTQRAATSQAVTTTTDTEMMLLVVDGVHTAENPYCGNVGCWCHTNVAYHSQVTDSSFSNMSVEELEQALAFFGIG
jgi:hypothetical protein